METERLVIRRLTMQDTEALLAIMGKPEVMYAWEHGFTHADVVQWIERQLARYRDDGYGYFALELKGEGKVIGQAGLMKTAINGREAVELGYILDDSYWHRGYAVEAARECLRYASADLGLAEVYCSIRPQNTASIRHLPRQGNASPAFQQGIRRRLHVIFLQEHRSSGESFHV